MTSRHVLDSTTGRRPTLAAALVGVLLAGAGLAACSGGGPATSTIPSTATGTGTGATGTTPGGGLTWILTRQALKDVSSSPTALAVLEAGHIYEIVGGKQTPVPGIDATVTADFKSYGGPHGMAAAVAAGALPAGVGAILYDPESWSYTPSVEQHHLASYVSQALALAHSKGLRLIVTPGVDLTGVLEQGTTSADTVQNYLSSGIDAAVAPADVVDIQAQRFEADAASYASFVRQVAEQIRAKNPRAVIVAGLSTNPASIPAGVTSTMLSSSIDATRGLVSGYWLNIPNPGQSCPTCPPADPSVGIEALQIAFG